MSDYWRIQNKKFGQVGINTSRGTFYDVGFRFYRSNETSMKTNRKQTHFGGHKLCNQVDRGKGIQNNTAIVTSRFLYEYILTKFGCPLTIVTDQRVHFINDIIKHMT